MRCHGLEVDASLQPRLFAYILEPSLCLLYSQDYYYYICLQPLGKWMPITKEGGQAE
jgi:hypothetical protein